MLWLLGHGGMDSRLATVSGILTRVVAAAVSLEARGRASAAAAAEEDMPADIAGMLHTRRAFTGTRPRNVTRATGPSSYRATKNLNSEFSVEISLLLSMSKISLFM